ncbi:MAG: hypothetical protein IJU04_02670 [Ruminococcus sp.]|nr:hypothetical protein [Ruminococcus sp.]
MADEQLHDGHRARMKAKFEKTMDFTNFEDHEILEMLLYSCYTRKNTNPIAHKLLNKFGSISNVLSASYDELVNSGIVGKNAALKIKFYHSLNRFLHIEQTDDEIDMRDIQKLKNYVADQFYGLDREHLKLFFTDNRYILKSHTNIQTGTSKSVEMNLRRITKAILDNGTAYFFLAHNHPSASSLPSDEDVLLTRKIIAHLKSMDIHMLDHFIVGTDGVSSMRQLGLIYDYE